MRTRSCAAEAQRLEHAEGLRTAAADGAPRVAGGGGGRRRRRRRGGLLGTARRTLEAQAGVDRRSVSWPRGWTEAATLVGDVAAELSAYLDALDADPARLQEVYERRAALRGLTRKYAEDVDGVIAWAERARARLAELDTSDERARRAGPGAAAAGRRGGRAGRPAVGVPAGGGRAGSPSEVTAELAGLAMPHARIEVAVLPRRPAGREPTLTVDGVEVGVGPDGVDEVELRLLAHPGAPALPLQKGASGGELSRVMLAIEVVFAGAGGPPTLVFDEVDAGVGGRAAVEIGRRLARLARSHQVLVVTHLPQVAAFADRHLVVAKDTGGAVTTSGVRVVEDTERARELARMLAGFAGLRPGYRARGGAAGRRGPGKAALTAARCDRSHRSSARVLAPGSAALLRHVATKSCLTCQDGHDASTHVAPDPERRTGRDHRHRAAGPADQAAGRPVAPGRHRGDRPRRPGPGGGRLAGRRRRRRGAQRQAVGLGPLPEPRARRC